MKPLTNFMSSTCLAANNISKADANSAAENSFKTKQHLKGSNLSNLFFGIKNISIFFIISILYISEAKAKNCLDFLPFGHNSDYVHLPLKSEFCVKYGKKNLKFKTDHLGGRIFSTSNNKIQIFGDSQVLGLDLDTQNKHYLNNYYSKDFVIYAAPNNGPYEVINFISLNDKNIKNQILINFNLSVDLFRVYSDWEIKNYVALKSDQLSEILDKPYKYKTIIAKSILTNKYFTTARKNNEEMKKLFMTRDVNYLKKNLTKYILKIDEIIEKLNLKVDFVLTMPYWIYQKKNNKFERINFIETRLKNILCSTFNKKNKLNTIFISKLNFDTKPILTEDKRHLRSEQIKLIHLNKYCKN